MKKSLISKSGALSLFFLSLFFVFGISDLKAEANTYNYTESFITTTHKDSANTTATWNTSAGRLEFPFVDDGGNGSITRVQSLMINEETSEKITKATLTANIDMQGAGSGISGIVIGYEISADGGLHWDYITENVINETEHNFNYHGYDLRWRAWYSTASAYESTPPFIDEINISYETQAETNIGNKKPPCDSYGDINLDGYITTEDSSLVADNITGKVFFGDYEIILADVNNNGRVDIGDAAAIESFVAGNITTFSVCGEEIVDDTPSATQSTIIASPEIVSADGKSKSKIIVTVKNKNGVLLSGKTVTISSDRSHIGDPYESSVYTAVTNLNGIAEVSVTSNIFGVSTYTAIVDWNKRLGIGYQGTTLEQKARVTFMTEEKVPDLIVRNAQCFALVKQDTDSIYGFRCKYDIKNIGDAVAFSSLGGIIKNYILYDGKFLSFDSCSSDFRLEPGEISSFDKTIVKSNVINWSDFDFSLDTEHSISIQADGENDVAELNKDNNIITVKIKLDSSDETVVCLPDRTLIKLPNDPKIYIINNCQRYWIRTSEEFKREGYKWENVKETTTDVINSLSEVSELAQDIQEGAIIRAIGDIDIYIVKYIGNKKFKRLILNPSVFRSYGHLRWEDVIEVEKETVNSFTTSSLVRNARTGRIYRLTANGDNGIRRHFRSISVMQRLGHDLDAVYEINETDENSYIQGEDLE